MDPAPLLEIRAELESLVKAKRIPGAVVLVARKGKIVHFDAVGHADLAKKRPMKTDAILRFYSMSKPITTVAAMMLPYSITFIVLWTVFLLIYWSLGMPLGLQASYQYP